MRLPPRLAAVILAALVLAGCATAVAVVGTRHRPTTSSSSTSATTTSSSSTSTTRPPTTTTTTTTVVPKPASVAPTSSLPPLGGAAPGLVAGRVTIVGDSVTLDAQPDLVADIKGAQMEANVSEQWYQGVSEVQSLRAEGALGAVVVVALGTNGPITEGDLASMMQALHGCSRVVFVTNHVPDWWQDPNDAILRSAPSRYQDAVVADWEAIAAGHPGWFYGDGTHMPIGGAGAQAFAALVASKV